MNTEKLFTILEWVSCAFGIIGAFTVAAKMNISGFGYIPFFLGSFGYCFVAVYRKNVPLFLLNLTFMAANTLGLVRWIIL